jgi:hypothetical protein
MEREPRISRNPAKCTEYMIITDDLQKSVLTAPDTLRYALYGWSAAESKAWSDFRVKCEKTYSVYSDPAKTGPGPRLAMHILIKQIRAYDNHPKEGHHLLDKVALNGTIDDCFTFNVKRGTTLEAKPRRYESKEINSTPVISIKNIGLGNHTLLIEHPENLQSKKLPEGIIFVKIYRYIGSEPPQKLNQYEMIGNAKRSEFISDFADLEFDTDKKVYAWYYARYESTKGLLGLPGNIRKAPVILSSDI